MIDGRPMVPLFRVIFADVFADADDPEDVMAGYERRLGEVREEIAPERLIEWQPGDGWEPLCRALDVPVPCLPFPHENSTTDYLARAEIRTRRDDQRGAHFRRG
jgi:hypothetical protein